MNVMKWLIALALLCAPAAAQNISPPPGVPASGCLRAPCSASPATTTAFVGGVGDQTQYGAYYGLRAYSVAIALSGVQKAVNVSRSSDSHTCDILIAVTGGLGNTINCSSASDNGQSGAAFCNSTTCSVQTWYDQVDGGSCDLIALTGNMTLVFNQFNGLPAIYSGAAATVNLQSSGSCLYFQAQPYTISAVVERAGGFTSSDDLAVGIYSGSSTAFDFFHNTSANTVAMYAGSVSSNVTASDSAFHIFQVVFNGSASTINVDNTITTGLVAGSSNAGTNMQIGSNSGRAQTVYYLEMGITYSAMSPTIQTTVCHNQYAYYGSAVSC